MRKIREFAVRKAAEAKSALISMEAANNSTEIVIIILVVVVIAIALGVALKKIIGDDTTGVLGNINERMQGAPEQIAG